MVAYLDRPDGERLAYEVVEGEGPAVVWLGGFNSDMAGTKAQALADWAAERGRTYVRFDYFGHGASSGAFVKGTISRWRADALAVIDELTMGPLVLVGSSMGGWIATLAALARPERVAGLVLIAPAADMTDKLIEPGLGPEARETWRPPASGSGPRPTSRAIPSLAPCWRTDAPGRCCQDPCGARRRYTCCKGARTPTYLGPTPWPWLRPGVA